LVEHLFQPGHVCIVISAYAFTDPLPLPFVVVWNSHETGWYPARRGASWNAGGL